MSHSDLPKLRFPAIGDTRALRLHYDQPLCRVHRTTGIYYMTFVDVYIPIDNSDAEVIRMVDNLRHGAVPAIMMWFPTGAVHRMWTALSLKKGDSFVIKKELLTSDDGPKSLQYFILKPLTGVHKGKEFSSLDFSLSDNQERESREVGEQWTPTEVLAHIYQVDDDVIQLTKESLLNAQSFMSEHVENWKDLTPAEKISPLVEITKHLYFESYKKRLNEI